MLFDTIINGVTVDETRLTAETLQSGGLALIIAARLKQRRFTGAAMVVRRFFPDVYGTESGFCEKALQQYLAGEADAGEADMTEFHEANPLLAGIGDSMAHGIYKLIVGFNHVVHDDIVFSAGDCRDLAELELLLEDAPRIQSPVTEALEQFFALVRGVAEQPVGSESALRVSW